MNGKKWIKVWVVVIMIVPILGVFNYLIDPYELYDAKYFTFEKKVEHKIVFKVNKIKKNKTSIDNFRNFKNRGGI